MTDTTYLDTARTAVRNTFVGRDTKIVFARILGSRAMGVEHEDSDIDVRVVYAHEPSDYATHGTVDNTVDTDHGNVDIHGWDVRRFTELLLDTDRSVVETLTSDVTVFESPHTSLLESEVRTNGNLKRLFHHYRSMAESQYGRYVSEGGAPIGRQFNVARAVACATFIHENRAVPPLDVWTLCDGIHGHLRATLSALAAAKCVGRGGEKAEDWVGEHLREIEDTEVPAEGRWVRNPRTNVINEWIRTVLE